MQKSSFGKLSQKGFTLIELLITIAVIGILAVAVLSAINPIEQVNKGKDTAKKSDAAEFLNAVERYFTTFGCYPWAMGSSGCLTSYTKPANTQMSTMTGGAVGGGGLTSTFPELEDKAELKVQFRQRTTSLQNIYVSEDTLNLVHNCFLPDSKTFQAAAKTKGLQRDGITTGCSGITGATGCHICIPE